MGLLVVFRRPLLGVRAEMISAVELIQNNQKWKAREGQRGVAAVF